MYGRCSSSKRQHPEMRFQEPAATISYLLIRVFFLSSDSAVIRAHLTLPDLFAYDNRYAKVWTSAVNYYTASCGMLRTFDSGVVRLWYAILGGFARFPCVVLFRCI